MSYCESIDFAFGRLKRHDRQNEVCGWAYQEVYVEIETSRSLFCSPEVGLSYHENSQVCWYPVRTGCQQTVPWNFGDEEGANTLISGI